MDEKDQHFERQQAESNDKLQKTAELLEVSKKENAGMKIEIDELRLQVAKINSSSLNKVSFWNFDRENDNSDLKFDIYDFWSN